MIQDTVAADTPADFAMSRMVIVISPSKTVRFRQKAIFIIVLFKQKKIKSVIFVDIFLEQIYNKRNETILVNK